jgi:hypothetical protein
MRRQRENESQVEITLGKEVSYKVKRQYMYRNNLKIEQAKYIKTL